MGQTKIVTGLLTIKTGSVSQRSSDCCFTEYGIGEGRHYYFCRAEQLVMSKSKKRYDSRIHHCSE
jgi:hypothetical protein